MTRKNARRTVSFLLIFCMLSASAIFTVKASADKSVMVSLGMYHSAAISNNGELYTWGRNDYGQLGHGDYTDRSEPTKVIGLKNVVAVSLGDYHSAALTSNGEMYTWGLNENGQLGHGNYINYTIPWRVDSISKIEKISLGGNHSAAVTGGELYTWGKNSSGELGLSYIGGNVTAPAKVTELQGVTEIELGADFSAALTAGGALYTWGANARGQLGHGDTRDRNAPALVRNLHDKTAVSLGGGHGAAIISNGDLYTWGANMDGQLGQGNTAANYAFTKVNGISNVSAIALGEIFGAAVAGDGSLYTWGYNNNGQLGLGDHMTRYAPVKVNLPNVTAVYAGGFHTAAVTANGDLYMWGNNQYGQLGLGNAYNRNTPAKVSNWFVPAPVIITWNYNGGAGWPSSTYYNFGAYFGELPVPNPRQGYDFAGWYTHPEGGTMIAELSRVPANNTTYWARWTVAKANLLRIEPLYLDGFRFEYQNNETLDLSGLKVIGVYSDSSKKELDGYSCNPPNGTVFSDFGDRTITVPLKITYKEGGEEFTYTFNIMIRPKIVEIIKEDMPTAHVDFFGERYAGLRPNAAYIVNGLARTSDSGGNIVIDPAWMGRVSSIVKIGTAPVLNSDGQGVITPARPAPPILNKADATLGSDNGIINGVTPEMEYRPITSDIWIKIDGYSVENLSAGVYEARFAATASSFASLPTEIEIRIVSVPIENGWAFEDSQWYWYVDGERVKGDWVFDGKAWYFMGETGAMAKNYWEVFGGYWYYLSENGAMAADCWVSWGGSWYYMNENGMMLTNSWVPYGALWYFMGENGAMAVETWIEWSDGETYYVDGMGEMVTGEAVIKGVWHRFGESGAWIGEV